MDSNYKELVEKYNVPVPRYTSFPTVPFWIGETPDSTKWEEAVKRCFEKTNSENGISIYIHLPYCEQMCTYCACTRTITKNHSVEEEYIEALTKEWSYYLSLFDEKPRLRELHLGGGTPTFFSSKNLHTLLSSILDSVDVDDEHEFSFEGHPNNTTYEHLQTLHSLGFNRVSLGVQDFDINVQKKINRVQSFETVKRVTEEAREIGYSSLNFDLIYGLPAQKRSSIEQTIEYVKQLLPDRIALYSYAHVPWKERGQRGFSEEDIPQGEEKRELYDIAKAGLKAIGYEDIGMDHFSLKSDSLYIARQEKRLHRNFMGYTTSQSKLLIGLGASSISDADTAYVQNCKNIDDYKQALSESDKPLLTNGCFLGIEDRIVKKAILSISCHGELMVTPELKNILGFELLKALQEKEDEGLIISKETSFKLTPMGMVFLRNICSIFDPYYRETMRSSSKEETKRFSKAL